MGNKKKKKKPASEGAAKQAAAPQQQVASFTEDDFPQLGDLAQALPSPTQPPAAVSPQMPQPSTSQQQERFSESTEAANMGRGRGDFRGRGQGRGKNQKLLGQNVDMSPESPAGPVQIESQAVSPTQHLPGRFSESLEKDPAVIDKSQDSRRGQGRGRGQEKGGGRSQDVGMLSEPMAGTSSQMRHPAEERGSESPRKDLAVTNKGRRRGRGSGRSEDVAGQFQFGTVGIPTQQPPTPASPAPGPGQKPQQSPTPVSSAPGPGQKPQQPPTPVSPAPGPGQKPQQPPKQQPQQSQAGSSPMARQQQRQAPAAQKRPPSTLIGKQMESVGRIKPPPRPDEGGHEGRPIKLWSNHIEVSFNSNITVYHYDVEFVNFPRAPKKLKRKVFEDVINSANYKHVFKILPVFDGEKNMYSACVVPEIGTSKVAIEFKVTIKEDGKDREFILKIKYAECYQTKGLHDFVNKKSKLPIPKEVIQVFDVVLRHQLLLKYIQAGRNLYIDEYFLNQKKDLQDLGGGVCAWFGAFTSLRPSKWKITLNVDMSTTAFVKSLTVIDYMKEVLELRDIPPNFSLNNIQRKTFAKHLKSLKIQATHQGQMKRKYPVLDIVRKNPSEHSFDCDGRKITTEQYFAKQYKYTLCYKNLQLLHVGQRTKETMLPMEVCKIMPGQKYPHKINEKQTAAMIKYAACRPEERFSNIKNIIKTLDFENNKDLKNFGMHVNSNLLAVEGRVLKAPDLQVKTRQKQNIELHPSLDGVWNIRDYYFYEASSLDMWGVLNFCFRFNCSTFVNELKRQASNMGMTIKEPSFINNAGDRQHPDVHFKRLSFFKEKLQLVICIVPLRTNLCTYENIKRSADINFGIPTQCIKERNAQGRNGSPAPALLSNLLLKINAKTGGINNILLNPGAKLPILKEPILILGADVTHPAPSEKNRPSIAALVGSMNPTLSRYVSDVKVQGHRVEPITDLQHMTRNMLLKFYHENKKSKPTRILMYRDGVSEGQFDYVLAHELQALQKACTSLEKSYTPAITFIVVQKRHHTRLLPQNLKDRTKSGNVPPGTVVDRSITHPTEFDWFLCSHLGLQGTSKPAHYHVLYDDCKFNSDPLQNLTNYLSYMCFRCTRSISIPAPTYYAHLVAFRARNHLTGLESDQGSTTGTNSSEEVELNLSQLQAAVTLQESVQNTMYFN